MDCCLCDIPLEECDEIDIECNVTKRSVHTAICDECLEMSQSDPFRLVNYFKAKLDRLDELTIQVGFPAMAN